MTHAVEFLTAVSDDDVPRLDATVLKKIRKAIESKLRTSPATFGKPLRESLKGYRALRVEDYRIVYRIEHAATVVITAMRHRRDVYRVAEKRV